MKDEKPDSGKIAAMFGADAPPDPDAALGIDDVIAELQPVAGDRVIGTLETTDVDMYVELTIAEWELDDLGTELRKRVAAHMAERVVEQMGGEYDLNAILQNATKFNLFQNEAEAEQLFKLQAQFMALHSTFWCNMRSRFECWNEWLSVRQGWRLVSTGKKFSA